MVIGAGQAGLSAAYHLARRGFAPAQRAPPSRPGQPTRRTYAVLDAEDGPGGAWRHRWKSLRMATVNGISDLPGIPQPDVDPAEPSSAFLTRYFAGYERELGIVVERPVKALAVEREDADLPDGYGSRRPTADGRRAPSSTPQEPGPGPSGRFIPVILRSRGASSTSPTTSPPKSSADCTSSW